VSSTSKPMLYRYYMPVAGAIEERGRERCVRACAHGGRPPPRRRRQPVRPSVDLESVRSSPNIRSYHVKVRAGSALSVRSAHGPPRRRPSQVDLDAFSLGKLFSRCCRLVNGSQTIGDEREEAHRKLFRYVSQYTASHWVRPFSVPSSPRLAVGGLADPPHLSSTHTGNRVRCRIVRPFLTSSRIFSELVELTSLAPLPSLSLSPLSLTRSSSLARPGNATVPSVVHRPAR